LHPPDAGRNRRPSVPTEATVIEDVTIVDVVGGSLLPHRTVIIQNGYLTAVHKAKGLRIRRSAVHINGTNKFLIPGLWDMHVHTVFGDWFPRGKEIALPLFIANGVTGVRDMGGELDVLQQWRKEITAGTLLGPRMVIAGPMLDGPQPRFPSSIAITTPEDGRRAVDDLKRRGVDFIKLQSLIPATPSSPSPTKPENRVSPSSATCLTPSAHLKLPMPGRKALST
jgi:imidazolonepropionase-like amidohydrolase